MRAGLSPKALGDIESIIRHYKEISIDLADRFIGELDDALLKVQSHPKIGSTRHAHLFTDLNLRFWRLNRYPFLLFYRLGEPLIYILRVVHERQRISAEFIGD